MRSEVRNLNRTSTECVVPDNARPVWRILSDLLPEIPVGETKSVRISAEIVDEKEEKVEGKECILAKREGSGQAYFPGGIACLFDPVVADWQPGEFRKVKSILFETPTGVPLVEFAETPRERLKRAKAEAFNKEDFESGYSVLFKAVSDYLDATEEAEKKGGG